MQNCQHAKASSCIFDPSCKCILDSYPFIVYILILNSLKICDNYLTGTIVINPTIKYLMQLGDWRYSMQILGVVSIFTVLIVPWFSPLKEKEKLLSSEEVCELKEDVSSISKTKVLKNLGVIIWLVLFLMETLSLLLPVVFLVSFDFYICLRLDQYYFFLSI